MATVLAFIAAAAIAFLAPAQSDTFWQLRAGADTWSTGSVPMADTYSYTILGLPWPNHSWLWQLGAYGLHSAGGFPLLTAVNAIALIAALFLSFTLLPGDSMRRLVPLLAAFPVMTAQWSLRPQGMSLLLLAVLLQLLVRERYVFVPVVMLLWANLHGSVALGGLVLVAATGFAVAEWLASRSDADRRRIGKLVLVTLLSAGATLLTPMGTGLWTYVVTSIGTSKTNEIDEWASAFQLGGVELMFWGWAVALVAVVVLRWRRLPARADRLVIVIALVLLPLAASSVRNIAAFLIAALPAVIACTRPIAEAAPRTRTEHPGLNTALVAVAVVAAVSVVAVSWSRPLASLSWDPVAAPVRAAMADCPGPIYNRFDDGGFFIWLTPEVPVFVDNRQDPYPQEFLDEHFAAERSGDYRQTFAEYGIRCAVLPLYSPTAAALAGDGWQQAVNDGEWVVFSPPRD